MINRNKTSGHHRGYISLIYNNCIPTIFRRLEIYLMSYLARMTRRWRTWSWRTWERDRRVWEGPWCRSKKGRVRRGPARWTRCRWGWCRGNPCPGPNCRPRRDRTTATRSSRTPWPASQCRTEVWTGKKVFHSSKKSEMLEQLLKF